MSNKAVFYRDVWLIFLKGDALITKILRKGFGHIGVLMNDGGCQWIYLSPNNFYCDVSILPGSVKKDWPSIFEERFDGHVLKVRLKLNTSKRMKKLKFVDNCVTRALYLGGLNIRALTPYSLYKKLVKMKDANKYASNIVHVEVIK